MLVVPYYSDTCWTSTLGVDFGNEGRSDQWKNNVIDNKRKKPQISSQKMQQPGVEGQYLKAVVGHSSCLAAQQPLPKTGTSNGPHPHLQPQTEQGVPVPKGWALNSLSVRRRWKEKQGWFLYLVLQLHDLVVLPVQLHVLVLHDFEELLNIVVLLLHKSLRAGREGWRRIRSSRRPSAVVLPL